MREDLKQLNHEMIQRVACRSTNKRLHEIASLGLKCPSHQEDDLLLIESNCLNTQEYPPSPVNFVDLLFHCERGCKLRLRFFDSPEVPQAESSS